MNNLFLQADWPAPARVQAFTTLRESQVSNGPQCTPAMRTAALQLLFTLPSEPIWLKQTHSTIAVKAIPENTYQEADASFSDQPQHVCAVLTADCLPLLVCNKQGTHVAAIHAGWRGLAQGIIEKTLQALNLPPSEILVWLGPAIGPTCFEVRKDVYDAFTQHHPEAKQAFTPIAENHWLANLYTLARLRLYQLGVKNIYGGTYCTHSDENLFFSYRRNGVDTGRMISLIWLSN